MRCWWLVAVVAVLPGCDGQDQRATDGEPEWVQTASQEYRDAAQKAAEADAEAAVFQKLTIDLLNLPVPGVDAEDSSDVGKDAATLVESRLDDFAKKIAADAHEAEKVVEDDITSWPKLAHDVFRMRYQLVRADDKQVRVERYTSLVSARSRHFWLWSTVGLASLLVIVVHNRRQEFRRILNGGRAKTWAVRTWKYFLSLAVLMGVVSVLLFVKGEDIEDWMFRTVTGRSPQSESSEKVVAAKKQLEESRKKKEQVELQWNKALKDRQGQLVELGKQEGTYQSKWLEILENRRQLETSLEKRKRLAARFAEDVSANAVNDPDGTLRPQPTGDKKPGGNNKDEKQKDAEAAEPGFQELVVELQNKADTVKLLKQERKSGRLILGSVLLGIVVFGHLLFWVGVVMRRNRTGKTCPQCKVEKGLKKNPQKPGFWECICGFNLRDRHKEMPKLGFSLFGNPSSGKTHWSAMSFRQIRRNNPLNITLNPIDSADFDGIVDDILDDKKNPGPTPPNRFVDPLVYEFTDDDGFGTTEGLLSLFDFPGELIYGDPFHDEQLKRGLQADGYLFFLDIVPGAWKCQECKIANSSHRTRCRNCESPKDEHDGSAPTIGNSERPVGSSSLNEERATAQFIKQITDEILPKLRRKSLRTPVAICISKIDFLMNPEFHEPGDNIERFFGQMDRIGIGTSLETIAERSRACEELTQTIWPGWGIRKQMGELFGNRVQFFPMTPVSLQAKGELDLSQVSTSPYAIIEPLLWLLHMTGHPVFSE